ncbi:hypothetical protein BBP40_007570 [Aspergillus hancockii]|nr:hypothetical protein BBP40_007570 [Aspergillus hancockii]
MATTVPSVIASVIPSVTRTDLDSAISLPPSESSTSGGIVGDDLQDVPESPLKERAEWSLRDITVRLDNSHDEEAANSPILAASDESDRNEDDNAESTLIPRSTSSTDSIPTPFDTSINSNFTSDTCPKFFKKFLSDSKFTSCYAISMLLRDSSSFFTTLRSAPATSRLLDLSCAADVSQCSALMSDLASRITNSDACGKDYSLGNPVVTAAYTDMIIYEPMYRSTCLKNPATTDYCFVDAVTNSSSPADYDIYSVPYGSSIINPPYPTCNKCLQASMDVFSQWAQKNGQPLAKSYIPSAKAINSKCGADFANVNITVGSDGSTSSATWSSGRPDLYWTGCIVALSIGASFLGLF